MSRERWRRIGGVGRVALALVAVAVVVHLVGTRGIGRAMVLAAPWLPLLLLCEGARIPLELLASRALYGTRGADIGNALWLRVHLVGYAMTTALPAGRAVAEAYKATALSRATSGPLAAAVGTASQSLALIANGIVSIPCAIAAYVATGFSVLTIAVIVHTFLVVSAGLALQLASRSERVVKIVQRLSQRAGASLSRYREACLEHRVVAPRALAFHVVARALQPVGIAILFVAVTSRFDAVDALVGQAVAFVGRSAGDLVPLQLGTTDGGFALAAPLLHLSAADAVAVSLLVHVVQATWSAIGAVVPLLWRHRGLAQSEVA